MRTGTVLALSSGVAGVRTFEDLDAWRLCVELRDLAYRMTDAGPVLANVRFRYQLRDAAAGPPRNLAEGFGRFEPSEFANCTRFAKASLMETQNHLRHGESARYFTPSAVADALRLSKRALGATKALHRYLRSCKGRLPWDRVNAQIGERTRNPPNQGTRGTKGTKGTTQGTSGTPEPPEPRNHK